MRTTLLVTYGDDKIYKFSAYNHRAGFEANYLSEIYGTVNITVRKFDPLIIPFISDLVFSSTKDLTIYIYAKNKAVKDELDIEVDKRFSYRKEVHFSQDKIIIISEGNKPQKSPKITIGILSGGNNDEKIKRCVDSIISNFPNNAEIIIAGPICPAVSHIPIKYVNPEIAAQENRIPICQKKNLIVASASHEIVVLMHDRYILPPGFNEKFAQDTFAWDVLCFEQNALDSSGYRLQDWLEIDALDVSHFASNKDIVRIHPFSLTRSGARLVDYSVYPKALTINGGIFAVKKSWFESVQLAEYLYWAEVEDDDFSLRAQDAGAIIRLSNTNVISMDEKSSGFKNVSAYSRYKMKFGNVLRLICHSIIKQVIRKISAKLNSELGFTRKKVIYTREKTLILDARKNYAASMKGFETIYIFGMEYIGDIRSILEKVKNSVQPNQKIVFEYCTFGVGFFSRLRAIRNCELLCYEISLVFKDVIALERMINTSQNNFLLEYTCIKSIKAISNNRDLLVLTSPSSRVSVEKNASLSVTTASYLSISREAIESYKTIFLIFDELSSVISPPSISDHFGLQKISSEKTPLIKSNLLVSADVFFDCMPVNSVSCIETFKTIFVHNIAIKGYSIKCSCS